MAAVQALYQMDLAGTDVTDVIDQFQTVRFSGAVGEHSGDSANDLSSADPTYFRELLRGVVRRQRDVDPLIDQQLAKGWRLKRIDSTLRAILRAGVFEILERPDVPARVVITEYINVAHAFFEDDEPKVVNGVLDAIGRQIRSAEFANVAARTGQN
jgi:N utilization substance protein B